MKPKPGARSLGRVTAPRTDEERASFRQLRAAHQQDGTPPAQARHDRVALARTQAEARIQAQRDRVSRELRTLTAPPTEAPARVNPPPYVVLPPRKIIVVRDQSTAPDPPTPVRAAPARTPLAITVRADTPTPPPAPPRRIEPPRPTSTHDSKPVIRGKDRQGGGPPRINPDRTGIDPDGWLASQPGNE